jgi:hypothetical protein
MAHRPATRSTAYPPNPPANFNDWSMSIRQALQPLKPAPLPDVQYDYATREIYIPAPGDTCETLTIAEACKRFGLDMPNMDVIVGVEAWAWGTEYDTKDMDIDEARWDDDWDSINSEVWKGEMKDLCLNIAMKLAQMENGL